MLPKAMKIEINSVIYLLQKWLFLFLFFGSIQLTYSQKTSLFHIPDSLKNNSYKELFEKQNLYWNDSLKVKVYINTYLHKAKNEKDTIKIANAYSQFATITSSYDYALVYYDSILNLTKNLIDYDYPGYAFMAKGMAFYNKGDYEKSIDNYLKAHKYAIKNNNIEQLLFLMKNIGEIKNIWGNYREANTYFFRLMKC